MKTQITKQTALFFLECLAVLETVAETGDSVFGGIPESHVYIALGSDYDKAMKIIHSLKEIKAIESKRNLITKGEKFDTTLSQLKGFQEKIKSLAVERKA